MPKVVQDVKGNLSCYTCSSLFGNDCWMANTSHDMRLQLSLPDTSGHRTLDSLGSDLLSLSAPSTPQSSVSIVMHSMPVTECSPEEKYCQVTRVEYSKAEEQSPNRRFWALERRCATTCLEGCISIGDGEACVPCIRYTNGSPHLPTHCRRKDSFVPLHVLLRGISVQRQ